MKSLKIKAGEQFPEISVNALDGSIENIGKPADGTDWKMVIVYRGRHCPLCTKYLNKLEELDNVCGT